MIPINTNRVTCLRQVLSSNATSDARKVILTQARSAKLF